MQSNETRFPMQGSKTLYQRYVEELRKQIGQIKHVPYAWPSGGKSGVTESITWAGKELFTPSNPPKSHCVGAVGEVFIKTLKALGLESKLTFEEIALFRSWLFIYSGAPYLRGKGNFEGGAGGLLALNIGQRIESVEDVQFGDLVQIWHVDQTSGVGVLGHAVIALEIGERSGRKVLINWSATKADPSGHKTDWHLLKRTIRHKDHPGKVFERIFYVSRPSFGRFESAG